MGPDLVDREHAKVKAKSRAAEVEVGVAVMELARAAPVFVRIAARKPRTRWELPVLICNARSVELQWYGSRYLGLLSLSRRVKWF
jgi:hypothetical protein